MQRFDPWRLLWLLKDVALLTVPAAVGAWAWFRTRHAHSWPSTSATILHARARSTGNAYINPWVTEFGYTYVVNGEYYSGYYRIGARSERRAEERSAGWKDRTVVVRYSPDRHDLSALLKRDQPGGQLGN